MLLCVVEDAHRVAKAEMRDKNVLVHVHRIWQERQSGRVVLERGHEFVPRQKRIALVV